MHVGLKTINVFIRIASVRLMAHVIANVPTEKSIPYFRRKGYPTQNVMAACDFDMLFTFVLPRWEGAVHDTHIFLDTIRKQSNNFPHPPPSL